jgi:LacI family transcriptional regulator
VARPGERIGLEAAALLDRLIHGYPAPTTDMVIPPGEVVERASTDTLAVNDNEELSQALRFIHEHIEKPISVEAIVTRISMSRRWLETTFKSKLHTTPHAYINQLRVKRVKELLEDSRKFRLKQVALDCGFTSTRQMNLVFQRFTGLSPRQFAGRTRTRRQPTRDT